MKYDDYVVIVPLNENKILTQKQYKKGAGKKCSGFPAGFKKENESPLETAQRELLEETGYQTKYWHEMGTFYDNTSMSPAKFTIFIANELKFISNTTNPDQNESAIENKWINLKELQNMSMEGACMALAREFCIKYKQAKT